MALGSGDELDRKSTRLNSSHQIISYAVFCLKKKAPVTPETLIIGELSVLPTHTPTTISEVKPIVQLSRKSLVVPFFFFFNDGAPTGIYTLSLHAVLPI